jgi:Na+/H+-dicarboxylate symporter
MNHFFIDVLEWSTWIVSVVLVLSFGWYTGFGIIFGLIASIIQTTSKKITEALAGIHELFDLLTHGVVEKIPRFNKNIPRNQLEDTFDGIGKNFLEQLRLKQGITAFISRILFGTILKVIKFFFLDNVVEELSKKEGDITSSDIEHAVRRVGVEMVIEPILEKFLYLQILNIILFSICFGVPIGILLIF